MLHEIIKKYGLEENCTLEKVKNELRMRRYEYERELLTCMTTYGGNKMTTERESITSNILLQEQIRLQQALQLAEKSKLWRKKIEVIDQDMNMLGENLSTGKEYNKDYIKLEDQMNFDETRDSEEAAVILEGSDLRIHNNFSNNKYEIMRPVYTQHEFDLNHGGTLNKVSWSQNVVLKINNYKTKHCSIMRWKCFILKCLPFISIMSKYKWKEWILADIIAGLIVGVMHIPQSMAYAMLASLDPMYGLYVSFFPAIIYFFFGTSRHNSMGTIAVVSLLSGKFLDKSMIQFPPNITMVGNITVGTSLGQIKASRAAGLTLCVGIVQVLMNIFQLGFLTRYLSDPLISGFTVGAAAHVFTSQVKSCFGLRIPKQYGVFNIPLTFYHIFKNIAYTNIPTIVMTLMCVIILVVTKEFINPRVVKKIKAPIPMELIVVIFGTLASSYLELNGKYKVKIVGNIYQGLPAPSLPDISNMSSFISDIIITAIIAFSICVSLAKIFGKKNGYIIDPNQECLAYGAMNIFSSFFLCYTSAASLSRSAVQESIGGKTQLTSLIASILVLIVVLFIGPLFHSLPQCILASIIVVALKGMFMQFVELKELWIFSHWDFATWVGTFIATMILDIDYGLIMGVSLSILTIMLRTQSPKSHILGLIPETDLYKNIGVYMECREIEGVKIFRYEGSLYYACSDNFRKSLYSKVNCNPRKILAKIKKLEQKLQKNQKKIKKEQSSNKDEENNNLKAEIKNIEDQLEFERNVKVHHIIIDCSTWGYIDFVGVKTLHQVIEEYRNIKVTVLLANPKTDIREMFARSKCYKVIDDKIIYVSVHDAVINSLFEHKMKLEAQEEVSSL